MPVHIKNMRVIGAGSFLCSVGRHRSVVCEPEPPNCPGGEAILFAGGHEKRQSSLPVPMR